MDLARVRLLQLASPALPVGAFAYSQGLEWAVEAGDVRDEASALAWIEDLFGRGVASCDLIFAARLHNAWLVDDDGRAAGLDAEFLATRDTMEMRADVVQMGQALRKLLRELERVSPDHAIGGWVEVSFAAAFTLAAVRLGVSGDDALTAYAWSWLENQVLAAVKLVPLGQAAGQRMLLVLGERIPPAVAHALATPIEFIENGLPGLALASTRHETQYTRLFRS